MIRRGLALGVTAALFTGLFVGCARERGASSDVAMPQPQPQFNPGAPQVGPTDGLPPTGPEARSPAWRRRAKSTNDPSASSTGAPVSATTTTTTAATTTTPSPTSSAVALRPADLFRAQDACLDHCDQFACMKIAEAYKAGAGVPTDPLAGRRYAIHACVECGAPGLAIVDACPAWGIDAKKSK